MKNIYLLMFCMLFCLTGSAQIYVSEPDFVGEVVAISDDGNATPLEKVNAQVKIKDQLMGLEKKLYVNGKTSPVRLKSGKILSMYVLLITIQIRCQSFVFLNFQWEKHVRQQWKKKTN